MVNLYKAKVLSYAEYRTAAIYHYCDTVLVPLNKLQDSFLAELGLSCQDALLHFNLAPLECRRDMAMLGLIHRCVIGRGPEHFRECFKPKDTVHRRTRAGRSLHSQQLADIRDQLFLEIERRSALGLSWVYNRMPNDIVMVEDVKVFQRNLQQFLKHRMTSGYADWKNAFSRRIVANRHPLR